MTEPLTRGQKMFNQRLLAEHCITQERTQQIWHDLEETAGDMGGDTLEASLASCNQQLQAVGLEIVSVSMPSSPTQKYFCMINKFPDDVTKTSFQHLFHRDQHSYCRMVIEKLVTDGPAVKRTALLNARNEINQDDDDDGDENNNKTHLSLSQAEDVLDRLQDEKWIQLDNKYSLSLAPRAYAELSYLLQQEFGMDKEELPQQIFYRN